MTVATEREGFLAELSRRQEEFLVWKHLDRALQGRGDVDAAAPRGTANAVLADARAIAGTHLRASHVISCEHVADKRLQFYVQPARLPQLFELDICTQPSRGLSPWAQPATMATLSMLDATGIRRLRPGPEAVVSLVYHGISSTGVPRLHDDEAEIVQKGLAVDLEGARSACNTLLPIPARSSMQQLLALTADGGWHRGLASAAYLGFLAAGFAHPHFTGRRVAFRVRLATGRECVMSDLARHHSRRVLPTQLPDLLRLAAAQGHRVQEL